MSEYIGIGYNKLLQKVPAPGQWIVVYIPRQDSGHGFDPALACHWQRQYAAEQDPFRHDSFDKPGSGGYPEDSQPSVRVSHFIKAVVIGPNPR